MRRMYVDFTKMFTIEIYFQHNENVESKQSLLPLCKSTIFHYTAKEMKKKKRNMNRTWRKWRENERTDSATIEYLTKLFIF